MNSLQTILKFSGVSQLVTQLRELDVPDERIKEVLSSLAARMAKALTESGVGVIDDFNPDEFV